MKLISTRQPALQATLSQAIDQGLAADGGLWMPANLPTIDWRAFPLDLSYPQFATHVLQGFFKDDPLAEHLAEICENALSFPIPLTQLTQDTFFLELFHGPTLSFKDVGARFLAECFKHLTSTQETLILVATSGDTGSAVASAFHQKQRIRVIVLYPKGQISKRQEQQITCFGENVLALAVNGNFDDCQRLVKSAFQHPWWREQFHLSTANSINIGRLLPQITYYAYSSVHFFKAHQQQAGYIIPTGNLGNATACYLAKLMGFPIREIALATNQNQVISTYLETGQYQPQPTIATLANAMDVGDPSNFERLKHCFPSFAEFKKNVQARSVNDEEIKLAIHEVYHHHQKFICPHTATAYFMRKQLSELPWIIAATADACKFADVIEPMLQTNIPIPPALNELLAKPTHFLETHNSLSAMQEKLMMFS